MLYAGQKTVDLYTGTSGYQVDPLSIGNATIFQIDVHTLFGESGLLVDIWCNTTTPPNYIYGWQISSSTPHSFTFEGLQCTSLDYDNQGNDFAIAVSYVPGLKTSDELIASTTALTGSSTPQILNGFTYGELVMGLFLFALVLMAFFGGIINQVAGVKARARNSRNAKNI